MSQFSPLLSQNTHLNLVQGVYQNDSDPYRDSALNAEVFDEIESHFQRLSTKSLFSSELLKNISEAAATLLDPAPQQYLLAMNFERVHNVLDLSQDIGGIAHYLADQVGPIDSVKSDPSIAKLSRIRCANKPNVVITSTKITDLELPKEQYDLITVGDLESLKLDFDQLAPFLTKLKSALSPHGVLLVSAKNQQRITKTLNHGDSLLPFKEAYTAEQETGRVESISRRDLRASLHAPGIEYCHIYASFARDNSVPNLYSEDYLISSVHALNHFYSLNCFDNPALNGYLLFKRLRAEKLNLVETASRFIAIVGRDKRSAEQCCNLDFFYAPELQTSLASQTAVRRMRSSQTVQRWAAMLPLNSDVETIESAYCKGELLACEWLNLLAVDNDAEFLQKVNDYKAWLTAFAGNNSNEQNYAITPDKLIVHARTGEYHITGAYTRSTGTYNPIEELTRGLFWFAQQNPAIIQSFNQRHALHSTQDFILRVAAGSIDALGIADFVAQEQKRLSDSQPDVAADFVSAALASAPLSSLTEPSASTGSAAIVELAKSKISQLETRVEDLLEHRSDLKKSLQRVEKQVKSERNTQGNLYAQIEHLEARLHAQHVRNDELHHHLLQRPSSRAKRFVRRWLDRVLRRPAPQPPALPTPAEAAEIVEEVPFYELPEGELLAMNTEDYDLWIQENTLSDSDIEKAKAEIEAMAYKPTFSILVPIYNTDPEYLLPMIRSVQNQIYPHWQLCLVDDSSPKTYLKRILEQEAIEDERICIKLNDVNQGISVTTNDALSIATGDYIALLDHDDEITIDALYENAKLINASPESELIYSDEDKKELDGSRVDPYFKPDYSPDLLDTNNYICHFTVIKKSLVDSIGGFREGMDGSQDHDLILRATDRAKKVSHIPRILYHWRKIPGSTAVEYDSKSYAWEAGRKSIEDLRQRNEPGVKVEFGLLKGSYRVVREIIGDPKVSIVIPFKDKPDLLDACLNSILTKTTYSNFEVIGVSNNSEQALTKQRMAHFSELDQRIKFVEHNVPFNFSAICNFGVEQATGDYIVLLNNDIEIISPDWIERMLEHAQRENIGAVGCKLLYPDGRIQHAGVVAGMVGAAGHTHKFFPESHIGYNGRLHMVSNVSAVTGAMLMVKKEKYLEVGGLDQENLAVAYNDIDLCLRLMNRGLLNVFTPHAKAFHHESISRGYEDTDEKMQRLLKEQAHFLETWKDFLAKGDPYYNPNLSLKNERFSFNFKD